MRAVVAVVLLCLGLLSVGLGYGRVCVECSNDTLNTREMAELEEEYNYDIEEEEEHADDDDDYDDWSQIPLIPQNPEKPQNQHFELDQRNQEERQDKYPTITITFYMNKIYNCRQREPIALIKPLLLFCVSFFNSCSGEVVFRNG